MNDSFFHRLKSLSGFEFEALVSRLLIEMGLGVTQTKLTGDGGVDIIAESKEPITGGVYVIQCKRQESKVSEPTIRDLYGTLLHNNASKGILITTSSFTSQAEAFASGKPLELINGERLRTLLVRYRLHESSDSEGNVYVLPTPPRSFWLYLLKIIEQIEEMLEVDSVSVFSGGKQYSLDELSHLIFESIENLGTAGVEIAKICIDVSNRFKTISTREVNGRRKAVGEHFSQIQRMHERLRVANVQYLGVKRTGITVLNSFLRQLKDFLKLNTKFLDYDGKVLSETIEIEGVFRPTIEKELEALEREVKEAVNDEIRTQKKIERKIRRSTVFKKFILTLLGLAIWFMIYLLVK